MIAFLVLFILCCLVNNCIVSNVHNEYIATPTCIVESSNINNSCDNNYGDNYESSSVISIKSAWKILRIADISMNTAIEARKRMTEPSSLSPSFPFVTLSFAQTLDGSM